MKKRKHTKSHKYWVNILYIIIHKQHTTHRGKYIVNRCSQMHGRPDRVTSVLSSRAKTIPEHDSRVTRRFTRSQYHVRLQHREREASPAKCSQPEKMFPNLTKTIRIGRSFSSNFGIFSGYMSSMGTFSGSMDCSPRDRVQKRRSEDKISVKFGQNLNAFRLLHRPHVSLF